VSTYSEEPVNEPFTGNGPDDDKADDGLGYGDGAQDEETGDAGTGYDDEEDEEDGP